MQAIRNKYRGMEGEIKQNIRNFGEGEAARLVGQQPTEAWDGYCKEIMGSEPYSYVTRVMLESDDELLKDLSVTIVNLLIKQGRRIEELEVELSEVKRENEIRTQQRKLQTIKLMNGIEA